MHDIKVGQKVFVVDKSYRIRGPVTKGYKEVIKVGRKYFYVKSGPWVTKFCMTSMREVNESNYKDTAYLCEADYEAEIRRDYLIGSINTTIRGWGWHKDVPTDKLQQIYDILKEHE